MINKTTLIAIVSAAFLTACSYLEKSETAEIPPQISYANDANVISLQNLKTRTIVICRRSSYETPESCAKYFEQQGYTRFGDIPYKMAKYDRLTDDTFPTRRWRKGERTPRW